LPAIPARITEHDISIAAPAPAVYEIIRDVTRWPQYFGPTVHVEFHERGAGSELIQIWATANGAVKTWISRRHLDPADHRIRFRQQVSQPPVAAMSGEWIFQPTSPDTTHVVFRHEFSAVDDDPAAIAWITEAVDQNTSRELAGLKAVAEQLDTADEVMMSFTDSVDIAGEVSDVYDFLHEAARWPDRLPHVASLELREEEPDIQLMAMSTRTAGGATHDTYSIRVCMPPDRIVYKQTRAPRLMSAHTGCWTLSRTSSGTRATSHHAVTIDREAVADVLGSGASLADARQLIREALGANSRTTLASARDYAEQLRTS
jgi:aromatase